MTSRIQVWSGVLPERKVITITHDGDPVDPGCAGCPAPCCRGLTPVLSDDECKSGRFEVAYVPVPPEGLDLVGFVPPLGAVVATLAKRADGSCVHQSPDGRCGVWEHRPKSCRLYDCRAERRWPMREFVARRFHAELTT